ncbi:MAG: exosortase family protein XrtF [Bacteroidia bacterium]|nr:exosortase family protein XrtF [Bacteroidia bacterium]
MKVFLIRAALLTVSWLFLFYLVISPHTNINRDLCYLVAKNATSLLSVFDSGYHVSFVFRGKYFLNTVCYNDNCVVGVGRPCNGLELFALFAGFVLAFPGNWKHKLWYIPAGVLVIHILNVMRVASLTLIQLNYPQYLQFNHKYTFTVLVYALTFGLWMIWVNKFSAVNKPTHEA